MQVKAEPAWIIKNNIENFYLTANYLFESDI